MTFNSKTCPILKKCRKEAFFSSYRIMELIVILLFIAGGLFVIIKTEDMIWRIGFIVITAVCIFLFVRLNIYKIIGMKETAEYLKMLPDEDYNQLLSQLYYVTSMSKPIYLLDGWMISPSVPMLAGYKEISGVEVVTQYYNGAINGYTVKFRFRGVKREVTMNRFMGFDPQMFKAELELKLQGASVTGYSFTFSEKRV